MLRLTLVGLVHHCLVTGLRQLATFVDLGSELNFMIDQPGIRVECYISETDELFGASFGGSAYFPNRLGSNRLTTYAKDLRNGTRNNIW